MWPGKIKFSGKGETWLTDSKGTVSIPTTATMEVRGENGHPDATVKFEVRDGRPEVIEIHVIGKPGGREIRSADMSLFNLDNLTANVMSNLGQKMTNFRVTEENGIVQGYADFGGSDSEEDIWATNRAVHEVRAKGRRGVSRVELERVAEVYREHVDRGPVDAVQHLLGYGSRRTASRRIKAAEEAGFLAPTKQGMKRS